MEPVLATLMRTFLGRAAPSGALLVLLGGGLVACGTQQHSLPPSLIEPAARQARTTSALVSFTNPSAGTTGIRIAINGQIWAALPILLHTKFYSTTISVPPGQDQFDFVLTGGRSAATLYHAVLTQTMPTGAITAVKPTFHGVVSGAAFVADPARFTPGKPSTMHVMLDARDATNNRILANSYDRPVVVTYSDPSRHTKIRGTVFKQPSDAIAIAFDGHLLPSRPGVLEIPKLKSPASAPFHRPGSNRRETTVRNRRPGQTSTYRLSRLGHFRSNTSRHDARERDLSDRSRHVHREAGSHSGRRLLLDGRIS